MKSCFLDFTNFKYSFEDKHSPALRGAETVLINLSYNLRNLDNEIYVFNNSSKDYSDKYLRDSVIVTVHSRNIGSNLFQ